MIELLCGPDYGGDVRYVFDYYASFENQPDRVSLAMFNKFTREAGLANGTAEATANIQV